MLQKTGLSVSEVTSELPQFQMAYEQVRVQWESKGTVMRVIAEESQTGNKVELLDGIKIFDQDAWVLVLPDALEPLFHVYAESSDMAASKALVAEYVQKIEKILQS